MFARSFSFTATACALLVLIAVGLLGPGDRSAEATGLNEVKKLLASDAQFGDEFGFSIAVSGDTAVVGASREDAGGLAAGAAYVFRRDQGGAGNWGEVTKLTASDAQAGDDFGVSVAVNGDTAVVGARWEDTAGVGVNAGAVYIFRRDEGGTDNWGEVTKLTASDAQSGDEFGNKVALSGDTVVVAAFFEDAGGTSAGAAYVFRRDQGGADNWGEVTKLIASDAQAGDIFGISVALSGDSAAVGARNEDGGGGPSDDFGAAYLFQRNAGGADNWGEVKKLTASDAQAGDFFGFSVAVSGDSAVVGAIGEDAGGSGAGAAYVFRRDKGGADNWGEVTKLAASDAQTADEFGYSVAVSGDTAIVGALREDAGGNQAGAAYVFRRDHGGVDNWGETTKLTASDAQAVDLFGISVALSGDSAVVGAPLEDAGGSDAGAAYVFDLLLSKPTPTNTPTDTPTPTPTPTPTHTPTTVPPTPIGGIGIFPAVPGDGADTGAAATWLAAGAVAGALALGGGAWYARRRRAG